MIVKNIQDSEENKECIKHETCETCPLVSCGARR